MLKALRIKNFAIIDDITIEFGKGLNILTGETGAGKSIIIDALALVMGARASSELLRSGMDTATVEVLIDINLEGEDQFITNLGIENREDVVIRRTISASGKSRAFVNGLMVNNQLLSRISDKVIDIHGQFGHQSLLFLDKQLEMVDIFGGFINERLNVANRIKHLLTLKERLKTLEIKEKERYSKEEFLKFQVNEITVASLQLDEEKELFKEYELLSNMGRIMELAHKAHNYLYASDSSCLNNLSMILKAVDEISTMDEKISETFTILSEAEALLQDASHFLRDYKDNLDYNPQRLEEVQDRLELIKRLKKKYGQTIKDILDYRDKATMELKTLHAIGDELESLKREIRETTKKLSESSEILSKKRKEIAKQIEKLVEEELNFLSMKNTIFSIKFYREKGEDTLNGYKACSTGIDRVEYMISLNPGEDLKPLSKITSGGELSRIMLALKSILSQKGGMPVLVFDEIDAGVGGKTAAILGQRLKRLSYGHQVICITHLPQIAVFGDKHIKIEKKIINKKTIVGIEVIEGQEQEEEIARMLGGHISDASVVHAKELIKEASKKK